MTITPHGSISSVTLHHGDCLDVLRELPDASVDSIITDPPYGLEFMGKDWAGFKTYAGGNPNMKPQASAAKGSPLSFAPNSSSVASHGLRQKNPRCRRCGKLMRGNGRCKCPEPQPDTRTAEGANQFQFWCEDWASECLRVLKSGGHMLAFGGTRTWHRLACAVEDAGFEVRDSIAWLYGSGFPKSLNLTDDHGERTGWGTALKPAFEPIVVARKPLVGTVAGNVLAHGTGALNIDGCRIGADERWPANVLLDESQGEAFDEARYFYTAKADGDERVRVDGTAHPTVKPLALMRWLVRLVTPPGGTVLEPFAGSGTTVEACILEGFRCIAIEREADYLPLIMQRINRRVDPVAAVLAADPDDGGLFDLLGEETCA